MSHQTFLKSEKKIKEKSTYNSLQQRKPKERKVVSEWKKDILSHHTSRPSKADRAEFPKDVVKEAIERSRGTCQCCKQKPCTTTHHVFGRGRGGRGVLSNAYRACGNCHINIESNDELKNVIIDEHRIHYGDRFWYDEQDWEEYNRKQNAVKSAEAIKKERMNQISPVVELITVAAGRSLKAKELRLLECMDDKEIATFANMMSDIIGAATPKHELPFGYGHFND